MFYRESGEFKTSYKADLATFPIGFDRARYYAVLAVAALLVPALMILDADESWSSYWLESIFLPFFIFSLAAIGLNLLVGYCGQVSLGTGGFMAVGAYSCYKLMTGLDIWLPSWEEVCNARGVCESVTNWTLWTTWYSSARIVPAEEWGPIAEALRSGNFTAAGIVEYLDTIAPMNIVPAAIISGLVTAAVGILFGLPSLRIKGFYLAVATLASQFFLVWLFASWEWTYNYTQSNITNPPSALWCFGSYWDELLRIAQGFRADYVGAKGGFWDVVACPQITGAGKSPWISYVFVLVCLFVFAWIATNLVRGRLGRSWMAIRDMDIAADIIGVNPLRAKLSAFAVSSFYLGVAGALYLAVFKGAAEAGDNFPIGLSFEVLFMVIIGGLGSIFGSMIGAAFLVILPVFLKATLVDTFGMQTDIQANLETILIGSLIIIILIFEPHGIAALWRTIKEKLRLWPFPH